MLFTVIVFTLLWLLQTVFLQNFYTKMVIRNVQKAALNIKKNKNSDDLENLIFQTATNNSLLIYLTDKNGDILFNADEHSNNNSSTRKQPQNELSHQNENPYLNSTKLMSWQIGAYRNLPKGFDTFLSDLNSSKEKEISYIENENKSFIYGTILEQCHYANNQDVVLYITTRIEAVGGTVKIIQTQLIWCTIVSIILSLLIALLFSKQFSNPIQTLTKDASVLAQGTFNLKFSKGFCLELDQLSEALQKTSTDLQKLESSRRELLANISHDLRTPLTMIKGYAEMLREFSWSDKEKREEDLGIIIKEADRLSDLVNDILDYSSIQNSSSGFEKIKFNMSEAVKFVTGQFLPLVTERGIYIEESIQSELYATGDEKQLKRVIYNFIDNAISHSELSKKITVKLEQVGNKIYFEVKDYGKGIPLEMQDSIWDKYFTARQQRASGTHSGLGLAISKEILTKSNARFGVKSQENKGSTFWFELE